jgi:hypothetical protein
MKELVAAAPMIHRDTLVVVDDSPSSFNGFMKSDGTIQLFAQPKIGGKGKLVGEYAAQVGAKPFFQGYQCAWTNLRDIAPAR